MKSVLKWVGIGALLVVVGLAIAPFFIRVDQFRPEIVKAVNQELNGTLELGKLDLSLWGKVRVAIDGLKVTDLAKKEVLSVKDASFEMPFTSLFSGSPSITFEMKEPAIQAIRDGEGKINLLALPKNLKLREGAESAAQPSAPATPSAEPVRLPAMALNARFGLSIVDARLTFVDQKTALTNTLDHLNVRIRDLSLSRKTEIEVRADLKTKMQDLLVEGPLKFNAEVLPDLQNGEVRGASLKVDFSADDLVLEKGVLFKKPKGIPTRFTAALVADPTQLKIQESALRFHNAEIMIKGRVEKSGVMSVKFDAKPMDLKPWSELIPLLKAYELEGRMGLSGEAGGRPEAPTYSARVSMEGLSAKGPNLKAKPVIDGKIEVATDRIENFLFTLRGPGNEVKLEGKLIGFLKPQITFNVTSPKGMDLDQWIEFPKPVENPKGQGATGAVPAQSQPAGEEDFDSLLRPLRSNEIAKGTSVDGVVSLSYVKAKGVRIDDLGCKIQFKNLALQMSAIRLRLFGGGVTGQFGLDLMPAEPRYSMKFTLKDFDMQKAVESQFAAFKNTVVGKLSASVEGSGASFNVTPAKKRLQLKGEFKVLEGAFQTIDVAKMASEALQGSLAKIGDKVPVLKGQKIEIGTRADSRYESIGGHFSIAGGMLDAPDFYAKAAPKRGIDLKGSTKLGLMDESIEARWELIDTQRMTGADQLRVTLGGKTITNVLAKGEHEPLILPITIGCKWSAPCMSYTQVPEYLAGVALARVGKGAEEAAKAKVKEAVKNAVQEGVGKALKGLFGR